MDQNQEQQSHTQVGPQSPVVQGGAPVEVEAIAYLFKGLVEPFARSQETAESEKTKRTQIEATTTTSFLRYSFSLATVILAIAAFALYQGKDQLTEKIIFAVVGFIGGFAFGKSAKKEKV